VAHLKPVFDVALQFAEIYLAVYKIATDGPEKLMQSIKCHDVLRMVGRHKDS
jgi:hypothetical protein